MSEEERKLYDALSPQKSEATVKKAMPTWRSAEAGQEDTSSNSPGVVRPKRINVSGGVLQEQAITKVQPAYPNEARTARIAGLVKIQVLISEKGSVIEATALEGSEQLLDAAIDAACQSTFKPTTLGSQAVRVSGVLSFNFTLRW